MSESISRDHENDQAVIDTGVHIELPSGKCEVFVSKSGSILRDQEDDQPVLEMHDKHAETHACDLISRQAAIDTVQSGCRCGEQMDLIEELKALPTAQQEIIRCKDCRYYIDNRCYKFKALDDLRSSNDYCSAAERREE